MRNKLPGQTMIAVEEHELARLREIAGCFESTDSQTAMLLIDCKETHRGRYPEYYEILEIGFLRRMEKAAKLAEDGA